MTISSSGYPNVLYLHSHDTGRYVEPYGYGIRTPRIQRLAEQGVLFRQAFCAASTCSASRACLLTGQYAHSNGMLGLAHRGWSLNDYSHHIVHALREVGYYSVLLGEQHISKQPEQIGYDEVIKFGTTGAADVAPVTIDLLGRPLRQPFFLSVGFFETHRQFFKPTASEENYVRPPAHLPDTPEIRADMAAFQASARSLDNGVGAVMDGLDELGLAENTLVICTTDHGIPFPRAKATLYDPGIAVLLIMRGPGGFRGGTVLDSLVSHLDLFPTICDLLGIERPSYLQGETLLPLIRGETDRIRDALFVEGTYHAAYEPQRGVRTDRWKYIRRFDDRHSPVLPNIDDSPSKDLWIRRGHGDRTLAEEELYDLFFDPNEAHNVIAEPANGDVADALRRRLREWMHDTSDPLLQGPVPPPPGAEFNDQDQLSPNEATHIAARAAP